MNAETAHSKHTLHDEPLPADWSVKRGLECYLQENGFTWEAYDAPRTPASFLGIRFTVPNPPRHRWAIMLHDLHHVATGFGTDPAGEGQLSAWEFRRGLRTLGLYVGSIILSGFLLGLVVAPIRTVRAWRASAHGSSLFSDGAPTHEQWLERTIGELRAFLGIPTAGLFIGRRGFHSLAPRSESASRAPQVRE